MKPIRTLFLGMTLLTTGLGLAFQSGCASPSPQERFGSIVPGMAQDEVKKTMDQGPTRFEQIEGTPYTSWYWGDERCVLFKEGKVVAKDSSTSDESLKVGPGSYEERTQAACLAPGQTMDVAKERIINIPGVGRVKIPKDFTLPWPTELQGGGQVGGSAKGAMGKPRPTLSPSPSPQPQ